MLISLERAEVAFAIAFAKANAEGTVEWVQPFETTVEWLLQMFEILVV
jgi:hypothetical protein